MTIKKEDNTMRMRIKLTDLEFIIEQARKNEKQDGWVNGIICFDDSTGRIKVVQESASSDANNRDLGSIGIRKTHE